MELQGVDNYFPFSPVFVAVGKGGGFVGRGEMVRDFFCLVFLKIETEYPP